MPVTIDKLMDEHAGRGQSKESGVDTYRQLYEGFVDDITDLRTKMTTILAKMDTDFTAQNGAVTGSQLDVDYATVGAFAAQAVVKES